MTASAQSPGIIQTGTQSGTQLIVNPASLSLGYQFDAAGNLVALRDGNQSEPALRTYGYEGLGRRCSRSLLGKRASASRDFLNCGCHFFLNSKISQIENWGKYRCKEHGW